MLNLDRQEVLLTEDLTHSYGLPRPVLSQVSVSFESGEMAALWGPSGSGKSTLLSLIGLLMPPESGRVVVESVDPWASKSELRRLRTSAFGWVLQNCACLESRTARENVRLPRLAIGEPLSTADDAACLALEQVGLGHRTESKASELSGGELQRMTIARMICQRAPIVLADEPTGQLDQTSSDGVARTLRDLTRDGQCVVVATHDKHLADMCDRVMTVVDGRVREL
jgi:putative ABC transport system ATP-binding protein